jgi:hypothetical protein
MRHALSMAALVALAACGGGGSDSDSDSPTVGEVPDTGDIVGADPAFIASLDDYLEILQSPVFQGEPADLPASGTATYAGIGRIFDSSISTADVTAESLENRLVVTDVRGVVDFGNLTVNVTQDGFRDVNNDPVSGQAVWSGDFDPIEGAFVATVNGEVGGTRFATGDGEGVVVFYGDRTRSGIVGVFEDAPVTTSRTFRGREISGDFGATSP